MKDLSYLPGHPDTTGWKVRHQHATRPARTAVPIRTAEQSITFGLQAWVSYAVAHHARFQSKIGDDYVLGPAWAAWGAAIRTLLNGETGNLDCGTLDTIIRDNLREQGFDPDRYHNETLIVSSIA